MSCNCLPEAIVEMLAPKKVSPAQRVTRRGRIPFPRAFYTPIQYCDRSQDFLPIVGEVFESTERIDQILSSRLDEMVEGGLILSKSARDFGIAPRKSRNEGGSC